MCATDLNDDLFIKGRGVYVTDLCMILARSLILLMVLIRLSFAFRPGAVVSLLGRPAFAAPRRGLSSLPTAPSSSVLSSPPLAGDEKTAPLDSSSLLPLLTRANAVLSPLLPPSRLSLFEKILLNRTYGVTFLFENVANPYNFYSCLRTLDCFGVQTATRLTTETMSADGVPTSTTVDADEDFADENPNYRFPEFVDRTSDLKDTPKSARKVARGSVKWVDVSSAAAPDGPTLNKYVEKLKAEGYVLLVSDVAKEAVDITTIDWNAAPFCIPLAHDASASSSSSLSLSSPIPSSSPPSSSRRKKVCVVMGNELVGVSPQLRSHADLFFTVPNKGFAESYNLSVATALTCGFMSSAGVLRPEMHYDCMRSDEGRILREKTKINWTIKSLKKGKMLGEALLKREGIILPDGVLIE